jgi:hypothetical protein
VQAGRCDAALCFLVEARSRRQAEHANATIGFTLREHEQLLVKGDHSCGKTKYMGIRTKHVCTSRVYMYALIPFIYTYKMQLPVQLKTCNRFRVFLSGDQRLQRITRWRRESLDNSTRT